MKDVVVIGSGPAGFAAALYTARAGLSTTVVTGAQLGGQVALTWEIDNYLGFHGDVSGAELIDQLVAHVTKFGAELLYDEVVEADLSGPPHRVRTASGDLEARAVIVATGASARRLGVPGEEELIGRGVSYCATCDGAFFRDRDVLVVGGGDSALEEAIFLTRFARSVQVVHRRDQLRAGPNLQARARRNERIGFVWNTVVEEIGGRDKVDRVRTRQVDTGAEEERGTDGVFVFIGHIPNSTLFQGRLDMDAAGYLTVDERMRTNVPGVFAAGEIMDPVWRQVATSVGQGSAAGMAAVHYLDETSG